MPSHAFVGACVFRSRLCGMRNMQQRWVLVCARSAKSGMGTLARRPAGRRRQVAPGSMGCGPWCVVPPRQAAFHGKGGRRNVRTANGRHNGTAGRVGCVSGRADAGRSGAPGCWAFCVPRAAGSAARGACCSLARPPRSVRTECGRVWRTRVRRATCANGGSRLANALLATPGEECVLGVCASSGAAVRAHRRTDAAQRSAARPAAAAAGCMHVLRGGLGVHKAARAVRPRPVGGGAVNGAAAGRRPVEECKAAGCAVRASQPKRVRVRWRRCAKGACGLGVGRGATSPQKARLRHSGPLAGAAALWGRVCAGDHGAASQGLPACKGVGKCWIGRTTGKTTGREKFRVRVLGLR